LPHAKGEFSCDRGSIGDADGAGSESQPLDALKTIDKDAKIVQLTAQLENHKKDLAVLEMQLNESRENRLRISNLKFKEDSLSVPAAESSMAVEKIAEQGA